MSPRPLTWTQKDAGHVELNGIIDEFADLPKLAEQLTAPSVTLDLGNVQRINSIGVRVWIQLMQKLAGKTISLVRCSPSFVEQLNCIQGFRGNAQVKSVLLPYACEKCANGFSLEAQIQGKTAPPVSDTAPCPTCGTPGEFDDLPDRYLNFVQYT
jgi:anti-anti-sigma regulatory factor